MPKPKAERHPGGARLSSSKQSSSGKKRPCKYGPRDADGFCPKKPATPRAAKAAKAPKKKPPCKYGPRDADGYCPKKPKTTREMQAVITLAKGSSTPEQREHAKKTLKTKTTSIVARSAEAGAAAAARDLHKQLAGTAKRRAATAAAIKTGAAKIVKGAAVIAPRAAGAAGVLLMSGGGGADWGAARRWAKEQLAETERLLKRKLTKAERDRLYQQYQAHHVTNIQKRKR